MMVATKIIVAQQVGSFISLVFTSMTVYFFHNKVEIKLAPLFPFLLND